MPAMILPSWGICCRSLTKPASLCYVLITRIIKLWIVLGKHAMATLAHIFLLLARRGARSNPGSGAPADG